MREIKFRAWHTGAQEMLQESYSGECLYWKHGGQPLEIMQHTGLKDMKRFDIFEGDIVVFHARTCTHLYRGYCQKPFEKGQIFIVKSLDSGWALTDPKIKDSSAPNQVGHVHNYDFWNHARSMEVIGNIYENPDLLS